MLKFEALHSFQSPELLEVALTHRSFANEQVTKHNERMEFLGDSVLGAVLSAKLMAEFPDENEGALSKRRASLVNEERLAQIAVDIGLGERIRLGKGELKTGGSAKPRILACGLEAFLGAVFLDSGFESVRGIVDALFGGEIERFKENAVPDFERDFKTRFQEWAHLNRHVTPSYVLIEEFGPAHARGFRVAVKLGDVEVATGQGKSKKAAEQDAAKAAIIALAEQTPAQDILTPAKTDTGEEA